MTQICINLLLNYENDLLIIALVLAIRAGKVRPGKVMAGSFSTN